jgi:hypothetical protein
MAAVKIEGYTTVRLLGKGGMSEVYEVVNERLGSRHALKFFTYAKDDPEVRRRFESEALLLARLNHPRVVKVIDFGTDPESGRPYFVMDLVLNEDGEAKSLADMEEAGVDEETIGRWYDDLREGLAYIHRMGVVHRDLKLQNVLVGPDGHVVLSDFGISKIFDTTGDGNTVIDAVNTIVKMREGRSLVMGSIGYMAPELEMGVAASPKSDWYALGVMVYKLLTGTWCDARTDISATLDTFDPAWLRIIPKLLHANPEGRECLSYAEEREALREKALAKAEERFLKEKSRGHFARHVARYLAAVVILLGAGFGYFAKNAMQRMAAIEKQLSLPDFASTFRIPEEAGEEETDTMPSLDQFQAAMVDALVLTHDIFADLKAGIITRAKAHSQLMELFIRAKRDDLDLFAGMPDVYTPSGENDALAILLRNAAKNLK